MSDALVAVKKRGAKKLPPGVKRNRTISMRLNDDEVAVLDKHRGKMQGGEWLRLMLLESLPVIVPPINSEVAVDMGRLGNNLNQIARRLNASGETPDAHLLELLIEIRIMLTSVQSALNGVRR